MIPMIALQKRIYQMTYQENQTIKLTSATVVHLVGNVQDMHHASLTTVHHATTHQMQIRAIFRQI